MEEGKGRWGCVKKCGERCGRVYGVSMGQSWAQRRYSAAPLLFR